MPNRDYLPRVLEMIRNRDVPVRQRSQSLIYEIVEHGLDLGPVLEQIMREDDELEELRARKKLEDAAPATPEFFVAREEKEGQTRAVITQGPADLSIPCDPTRIEGLECGDPVLVDVKNPQVVGRNGHIPYSGDVVTVAGLPRDKPHGVVVNHHDGKTLARVSARLRSELAVGNRVVFDAMRRFVFERIHDQTDGCELLTPTSVLDKLSRSDLGAPNPVLDELMFVARQAIEHADWCDTMRTRTVRSYLFAGPTGTGKSFTLQVLARELTDYMEELTGARISRLVMVDASTFYSPLFGDTEAKIVSFFERLQALGRTELKTKDGRKIRPMLLIVLEEAEALLRARGEIGGSSHLFDRPLALMLQKLSSVAGNLDVTATFIATSNSPTLLDPAALRRLGMRRVIFGTLGASQAASVLDKKIHRGLPLRDGMDSTTDEHIRQAEINQVVSYLFGNEPDQAIAQVCMQNGDRRDVCRRDLVTGAQIEEAISQATDLCLRQSHRAGCLLGLDAEAVIRSLETQYATLATLLTPHNLPEHCPQWFAAGPLRIESVRPLRRHTHRPRATLVH